MELYIALCKYQGMCHIYTIFIPQNSLQIPVASVN